MNIKDRGNGYRLTFSNVDYFYPNLGKVRKLIFDPHPDRVLLQEDFGKKLDCTLTSMAYIFGPEHYDLIEHCSKRYGYNGDLWGTWSISVRKIMQSVMDKLGGEYLTKKANSAYLKNIGVKWELCKKLCEKKIPYILTLTNDGRNFYKNHSVTVIGYARYENNKFLIVYDNWFKNHSLIDFDAMSVFCSIVWME